jgi:hypothetical protein
MGYHSDATVIQFSDFSYDELLLKCDINIPLLLTTTKVQNLTSLNALVFSLRFQLFGIILRFELFIILKL